MLDVMQIIKDEVVTDDFVATCKDFIETIAVQTAIVFVCNSRTATRHMITLPSQPMHDSRWRKMIAAVAQRAEADAILTVVTSESVEDRQCMTITVETMLDRYATAYPYERVAPHKVDWEEPSLQLPPCWPGCYGDLLPAPAGMASA